MEKVELIKRFLLDKVENKIGSEAAGSLCHNQSLITLGVFDSLDFISVIMELENSFEVDIDFENIDPEKFTSISGLIDAVA